MLEVSEIKRLIAEDINSDRKRLAAIGQRYYEGDHDIRGHRLFYYNADGELVEDKTRSNERISHPFFTELVDQAVSYILSKPEEIITSDTEGLQDHLDKYFDEDFWAEAAELLTGTQAKGFEYLYAYKNAENRLSFKCADGMGVVEVREKDTDKGCKCFLYWYVDRIDYGRKPITRIQIHDGQQIYYFVQSGVNGKITPDKDVEPNPKPNVIYTDKKTGKRFGKSLGFIPFFRLDNNRKQFSALKPIKALIDDYDLMECGLSNNLQDFDTPIHVVKGFEGDNLSELQQNIKTKKVVGVGESGGLDILTVNVPYEARKAKADEDEKNIFRFGMGLDTQSLKDTSATTNIAIKMAYTLLDLKAKKLETRFKKFLKEILRVVLAEINAQNGTDYQVSQVNIDFPHEININEAEVVQNEYIKAQTEQMRINSVLSVATVVGDEETLKAICDILDLDFEKLKGQLERVNESQNLDNAVNDLEGVVTEDEPTGENRTEAIPE